MKNLKNLLFLFCLSAIVSCSGLTDDDIGVSGEGTFTAKVDGTAFTSLSVSVSAAITNGVAVVQGSNSAGEYIRINISNYNGVGTYKTGDAISNTNSLMYGTVNPIASWMSTFDLGNGTIEVTEDTGTSISGTFSFTGINANAGNTTKTVTEGKFNAPIN